ncbi:MAG: FlgD immunoglobulin-like domain containing protein, partial [bacterium]
DTLSGEGRIDAYQAVQAISEGIKFAQLWVINQASATGILQVTDITQDEDEPWIVSVSPTQFTVPIHDSQAVWVTTDTIGMGLTWGEMYDDTLLVWSNSILDDNPEMVPVILIMATVGIEQDEESRPTKDFQTLSACPNPFRHAVRIDYAVTHVQNIHLAIYDVCGKKVRTLINEIHKPGDFSIFWDSKDDSGQRVSAGIYFSRIRAEKSALTNKLILIK